MTKEEWAKLHRKMQLNSVYGTNLCKEIMAPKDQALTAIQNAWSQWPEIKDTVTDFGFGEWCKHVHGFEYRYHNSGQRVITTVLDEQKYAWFLLKWA
jgi:hypothetical protein